jgi:1-acyl-sn-glycerol-3-phosphate acyltransferase
MTWSHPSASELPATVFHDAGHGYDVFGFHPPTLARVATATEWLYRRYFRVTSHHAERIPATGPAILIANHAGFLPVDAGLLALDVLRSAGRVARPIADRFVPRLPWVSRLFSRVGVVSGTASNVRRLLEDGALLIIFPEGVTGTGKHFRDRYQLQAWRVGHVELAIRHRAPIVPVAIIGGEEAWPALARIPARPFGAPYLPIPASIVPLPVRFHIHYGEPLELYADAPARAANDPDMLARAAARTRAAVADLVAHGLATRGER